MKQITSTEKPPPADFLLLQFSKVSWPAFSKTPFNSLDLLDGWWLLVVGSCSCCCCCCCWWWCDLSIQIRMFPAHHLTKWVIWICLLCLEKHLKHILPNGGAKWLFPVLGTGASFILIFYIFDLLVRCLKKHLKHILPNGGAKRWFTLVQIII